MTDETQQPEVEAAEAVILKPGFHVFNEEGISLGRYDTAEEAEVFADGHPRHNGLTVTVEEVKG